MSTKNNFSRAIYYARKERGLTQRQAAEALSISVDWLKRLEKGQSLPGAALLIRMADFYAIDIRALLVPPPLYRYTAEAATHYRPEWGHYTTFDCHVHRWNGKAWERLEVIPDIGSDPKKAAAFAERCTLEQAEPYHIRDLLEDWLKTAEI